MSIFKKSVILVFILSIFFVSGCKSIFRQTNDKYAQVEVTKENLEEDTFYVKSGTKFVKVHKADVKSVNDTSLNQNLSLCFLTKDYQTVPTLYKGEILAIASKEAELSGFKVIRYKELGYSLGVYGITPDENGDLSFKVNNNAYKNSNAYTVLSAAKSPEIRIKAINNEPAVKQMITSTGVLNCLSKDAAYDFTIYSGTYYSQVNMIADTFILQEFEYYKLEDADDTKNGYLSFSMPEDAKSGWYYISGHGLFKYVAAPKGIDETTIDYNEPYYTDDAIQEAKYSQKFSTSLDLRMKNIMLQLVYDPKSDAALEEIRGTVYAPDNTEYTMDLNQQQHYLFCSLEEAMAGKWTLYVDPQDLLITDMRVVSLKDEQAVTVESYPIQIEEEKTNFQFQVTYTGTGDIYALVIYPDGTSHEMSLDEKHKSLYYTASYIPANNYEVKVYHYTDTNVESVDVTENTITDSDIITVTE